MTNRLKPHALKSRHYLALTFVTALTVAALLIIPFIIYTGGVFY